MISTSFYNMIFDNIYELYLQDGHLDNIEKYNFFFVDGVNKMTADVVRTVFKKMKKDGFISK